MRIKKLLRSALYRLVRHTGMPLIDTATGKPICRIWVLPWRGRLRIIGIPDYLPVTLEPQFVPGLKVQSTILVATLREPPDYLRIRKDPEH
jgi:hypothetical protein